MKKFILVLIGILSSGAVNAKLSSDSIKTQASNIEAVLTLCKFNKNVLNKVKSDSVGSAVSSGIATVASGASVGLSVGAGIKSGKMIRESEEVKKSAKSGEINPNIDLGNEGKNDKISAKNVHTLKGLRLGSTIAAGVATGANLASVALSAGSVKELAELMDSVDACQSALNSVSISTK